MVTEVPLPKGPAAKLQAACLQGGGSIGEQDGGVTGISGPSKECHRPAPSDKNHSNHSATFPCRGATLLKRKVLAMNRHNISYLTQYVQNVTIPTRGTSHVRVPGSRVWLVAATPSGMMTDGTARLWPGVPRPEPLSRERNTWHLSAPRRRPGLTERRGPRV